MTKRINFPEELPAEHTKYCFLCGSTEIKKNTTEEGDGPRVKFHCGSCGAVSDRVRIWDPKMIQYFNEDDSLVHEGAGVVIQNKKGEILLFMRTKYPFLWTIPGGHMEPGEDPEKAVIREIEEEVGINVSDAKLIFEGMIVGDECMGGADIHNWHLYHSVESDINVTLNDEGSKFGWFSLEKIPENITFPVKYLLKQDSVKKVLVN